jgi:hypothetical protein
MIPTRQPVLFHVQHRIAGNWYNLSQFPLPYQLANERVEFYKQHFHNYTYRIKQHGASL